MKATTLGAAAYYRVSGRWNGERLSGSRIADLLGVRGAAAGGAARRYPGIPGSGGARGQAGGDRSGIPEGELHGIEVAP
jgi:hypothetical protein